MYGKCLLLTKDKEVSKDLTHDILIKVFLNLSKLKTITNFSLWVHSITYNHCIDYLRLKNKFKHEDYEEALFENITEEEIEREQQELKELRLSELEVVFEQLNQEERLILLMRYKDGPPEYVTSPEIENKIMHTTMTFGNGCELKASDSFHQPLNKGNNFHVSVLADDDEQGQAIFNGLSKDGTVIMPYNEVFWGGKFGSLVDKYGIHWMVSFDANVIS